MRAFPLSAFIAAFMAIAAFAQAPNAVDPDVKRLAQGNSRFALALDAQLAKKNVGQNLIYSPYSISSALAMTYAGARAETATQMARVLQFTLPKEQLHPAFNKLNESLRSGNGKGPVEIHVANALWGSTQFSFHAEFLELNKKFYGAELTRLDFMDEPNARETINRWIDKQTNGMIPDLLAKGNLKPDTSLVLTNAIYLKAAWHSPFDKELTAEAEFHVDTATRRKLPMMNATFITPYFESAEFQLLKLPYKGKRLAFIVLLPAKNRRLGDVMKKLPENDLSAAIGKMRSEIVQIGLPRFKAETSLMLKGTLTAMGMSDAFSEQKADFLAMSPRRQFIDEVVHKAIVEVDEVGTEAAAATAVLMLPLSSQRPKMFPFRADRPFAFFIHDEATSTILFAGRLVDPR